MIFGYTHKQTHTHTHTESMMGSQNSDTTEQLNWTEWSRNLLSRIFFYKTVKVPPNRLCCGTSKWYIVSVNTEKLFHILRGGIQDHFSSKRNKLQLCNQWLYTVALFSSIILIIVFNSFCKHVLILSWSKYSSFHVVFDKVIALNGFFSSCFLIFFAWSHFKLKANIDIFLGVPLHKQDSL